MHIATIVSLFYAVVSTTLASDDKPACNYDPEPTMPHQSPIDLPIEKGTPNDGNVIVDLHTGDGQAVHKGHTVQVNWGGGEDSFLALNHYKYKPIQFHFHTPSK